MASDPGIGGEWIDGAREEKRMIVYKRKGKGQRKQSPFFALAGNGSIEKPEGKLKNENDNNDVCPPETLARESLNPIVEEAEPLEDVNLADNVPLGQNDNNDVNPPQTLAHDSVEEAEPREDVNLADQSVEVPSLRHDDVNTVVVDENSIKEPSKSLAQEDDTTVVVDKNPIEVPVQIISLEDASTFIVDKNPIEVSSEEEDVHVVDEDNPENVLERDVTDAQDPTVIPADSAHVTTAGSMPVENRANGRIRIRLAPVKKQQKEEMRKKLEDKLNVVRGMIRKIEDKEAEIGAYDYSRVLINTGSNNGGGRIFPGPGAGRPREVIRASRPVNHLRNPVFENIRGIDEHVEKEKRQPKANQFYRTSEFLLGDKLPPPESNMKSKASVRKQGGDVGHGFVEGSNVFKKCSTLLEKLMKHKLGWVFNEPVDVMGLGLHDYFTIIKHPMDLGTIKSALIKNLYKSPREFAENVRLTFHNAMTYNPKGQDVHVMAETLLQIFEEKWAAIETDYNRQTIFATGYEMNLPTPTMRSRLGPTMPPPPINVMNTIERADWSKRQPPGRTPISAKPSGRAPALKKPKANEPNKRDMTVKEKNKLREHLMSLPEDKLEAIIQIANRRTASVEQGDKEVELDIDILDPETLWELDRFAANYKKGLSKKKRRAELAAQARAEAERNSQQQMAPAPVSHEFSREGGNTATKTLPTSLISLVEKQRNETSRSSSSSSSSSSSNSSSDSDSDSSSSSG